MSSNFQNDLESYIQRQNVTLQSEASLKQSEDIAEQQKIQMEIARDEAGGQIAMGSILPIDMASRISGMKNFAKNLIGLKEGVTDNDALKNVKGWSKRKLGFKDTDGDDVLEHDAIKMQPITAEDFEEPEIGSKTLRPAPAIPKTRDIFGDADDWLSGGDRSIISRVRAAPSSIDWEDIASNPADYVEPTYSAQDLGDMARESREMAASARASSLEKSLGSREPEISFKFTGISQGEHEFQRGIKSDLSDAFAERRGLDPIEGEVRGFGQRFGGGVESGMQRAGEQRGSSMLADVMRGEASVFGDIKAGAEKTLGVRAPSAKALRLGTTGEEIVPEIRPTIPIPDISEITPVARRIPQFQQGGLVGDIPDFPERMQIPETEIPSELPTIDTKGVTSRLRSTMGRLGEEDDLDEEGGTGGSWLSSMMPESFGEGLGTGLAIIGLGAELYTGITTIKDAFKESHLIDKEQADINRESQAIYNRPTFDFGQQALSNRDSGLGESSFNHF